MTLKRLAIIADDPRLARAVEAHLQRCFGPLATLCPYDEIPEAQRQADALVVLVAASGSDTPRLRRLTQEAATRPLPPLVVIAEGPALARIQDRGHLDPWTARWVNWPDDAAALVDLVNDHLNAGDDDGPNGNELTELIARRLREQTPSLLPLTEALAVAATHDVTVLLTGETGTGKTFLARLIHEFSPRRKEPFLVVPCGALAANLIESEFFGHSKGAFTGADKPKVGKFAAAGEGSILLDEIDALGLEQQAKLLRVIETGEYEAVGSNSTQVNRSRIIAASNWNLEEAVAQGKFRQDLYYRLNVVSFYLPPLRDRVQDIAPLVRAMVIRFNQKFRRELVEISQEALAALQAYPWPGNIRQLENGVQQAVLMSSGPVLQFSHLPKAVQENICQSSPPVTLPVPQVPAPLPRFSPAAPAPLRPSGDSLVHNREAMEKAVIQKALMETGYRRAHTAKLLGISRVTLYKKMKKYGLMEIPFPAPFPQAATV